jgi:hypothetical protein
MTDETIQGALTPADRDVVAYLARRIAYDSDLEPGLLEDPERYSGRFRSYLSKTRIKELKPRWSAICDDAHREAHNILEGWAHIWHIGYAIALISLPPIFVTSFDRVRDEGSWSVAIYVYLACVVVIVIATPFVSRCCLALSAWFGNGRVSGSGEEAKENPVDGAEGNREASAPLRARGAAWRSWVTWLFRPPGVKTLTPSFLVIVVGLGVSTAGIMHALEAAQRAPADDIAQRLLQWVEVGRAELAVTVLLGMSAYLIEHVLEHLALTRGGIKAALKEAEKLERQARLTKNEIVKRNEEMQKHNDALIEQNALWSRNLRVQTFESLSQRAQDLDTRSRSLLAELNNGETVSDSVEREERISLMVIQNAVSRRLTRFVDTTFSLLDTINKVLDAKEEDGRSGLYRVHLVTSAFESALESQNEVFSEANNNGRHFSIAAPFEALASLVSKCISGARDRSKPIQEITAERNLRFYTVVPIRPRDFFSRATWTGDPSVHGSRPDSSRAKAWLEFLRASSSIVPKDRDGCEAGAPEVIRHFIGVDFPLIQSMCGQLADNVQHHYRHLSEHGTPSDPPLWNPMALEDGDRLLHAEWVRDDLELRYVHPASTTAFPWQMTEVAKNRWATKVDDEAKEGGIPLAEALRNYHLGQASDTRGSGLRMMTFGLDDWDTDGGETGPKPNTSSPLRHLLRHIGSEWLWVDYFAAQLTVDGKSQWLFAVKSEFSAEMGTVNMHLHFADGQSDWPQVTDALDELFGIGEENSAEHIESYDFEERGFKKCVTPKPR